MSFTDVEKTGNSHLKNFFLKFIEKRAEKSTTPFFDKRRSLIWQITYKNNKSRKNDHIEKIQSDLSTYIIIYVRSVNLKFKY